MKKKLEAILGLGSLFVGSAAIGVGLYYNVPIVTGLGLILDSYPLAIFITRPLADEITNYPGPENDQKNL